jgi:hypothetical protein
LCFKGVARYEHAVTFSAEEVGEAAAGGVLVFEEEDGFEGVVKVVHVSVSDTKGKCSPVGSIAKDVHGLKKAVEGAVSQWFAGG